MLTQTCRVLLLFGLVVPGVAVPAWTAPVRFNVTFTKAFSEVPLTGRLVLLLDTNLLIQPRDGAGDPEGGASVDLAIANRVEAPRFEETKFNKEVDLESKLLGEFYGRPIRMKAAVVLPPVLGARCFPLAGWKSEPTKSAWIWPTNAG